MINSKHPAVNCYKAVACDLDGTLLNSNNRVAEEDIRAFETLGSLGITRIIATGRSLFSFNSVIAEDFPIDYLIVCAGGAVIDFKSKKVLESSEIPADKVKEIVSKLRAYQIDYQVRGLIPYDHYYFYERFFDSNPDFDRLNKNYKDFAGPVEAVEKLGSASRIISIAPGLDYIKFFETFASEYSIIRATSPMDHSSVWMEIYPPGVDKGKALLKLLKRLSVTSGQTIGLGNDYNDIHFLDITGRSFMTANAPDVLKKKYDTTVSHNRAPLADVLRSCGII